MTDPRYPIGKFEHQPFSQQQKIAWLFDIEFLPQQLEEAVNNLNKQQLQTPYREGGWTVQQLVHHIADSHMHAYLRFKFALTEDNPTIKPYNENTWASLPDVSSTPVKYAISLLHALHFRWLQTMLSLKDEDWNKTFFHPEKNTNYTLWQQLAIYAWHGKHHVAHINKLKNLKGW